MLEIRMGPEIKTQKKIKKRNKRKNETKIKNDTILNHQPMYKTICSLGPNCHAAQIMKRLNWKQESHPFNPGRTGVDPRKL